MLLMILCLSLICGELGVLVCYGTYRFQLDVFHILVYLGAFLMIAGPWLTIKFVTIGTNVYHGGLVLLIIAGIAAVVDCYRQAVYDVDLVDSLFIDTFFLAGFIYITNWLSGHLATFVLETSNLKLAGNYKNIAMGLRAWLCTILALGFLRVLLWQPVYDKLKGLFWTHFGKTQPAQVIADNNSSTVDMHSANKNNMDDGYFLSTEELSKRIALATAKLGQRGTKRPKQTVGKQTRSNATNAFGNNKHASNNSNYRTNESVKNSNYSQQKCAFGNVSADSARIDDSNSQQSVFSGVGSADYILNNWSNDRQNDFDSFDDPVCSFDEAGLLGRATAHVRYSLFQKYNKRCVHCGRTAASGARLVIDFKSLQLAKKYRLLNATNPAKIPLDALAVVCANDTIDHILYDQDKFVGSGANGNVLVSDIRWEIKQHSFVDSSVVIDEVLRIHPDWKAILLVKYHHSCQVCGYNPNLKRQRIRLKVDFKDAKTAIRFLRTKNRMPAAAVKLSDLTITCQKHDVNYMLSMYTLFYKNPKVFKAEQRRLANSIVLRRYVTRYGNQGMGARCAICGKRGSIGETSGYDSYLPPLHLDHIYPVSKGGLTRVNNLRWLCKADNESKSDLIPEKL